MDRTCPSCRGAGRVERSLSTHGGLAGPAAIATATCTACEGDGLVRELATDLGELYVTALAHARGTEGEPWTDLADAVATLARASRLVLPMPAAEYNALRAVLLAERVLARMPLRPLEDTGRGALWGTALHMAARAMARLRAVRVEAVATTRTEGTA